MSVRMVLKNPSHFAIWNNLKQLNDNSAAKCYCYLWKIPWDFYLCNDYFYLCNDYFLVSNYNIRACKTHICNAKLSFCYVNFFSEDQLACLPMRKISLLFWFCRFRMPKNVWFPFNSIPGYVCWFLFLPELLV